MSTYKPQAVQTVKQIAGKWVTYRYVDCPDHVSNSGLRQRSSDFLGPVYDGWEFRCKENANHLSHRILARPPQHYPHSPEEVDQWMKEEIADKLYNAERVLK